jgi:type IV secretory pathway VirB9-like protein
MKQIARLKLCSIPVLVIIAAVLVPSVLSRARPSDEARVVKYGKEDIVPIRAKVRFSTLIVLPDDEEILDFTTGDKDFWIINGAHNLCYVHPARAGIRSNLNLITASGRVYSFLLTEISSEPNAEPDLKVFIEPKEASGIAGGAGFTGYVRAGEAEAYKKELETLRAETTGKIALAQSQAATEITEFRSAYQTKLQFDFTLDPKIRREPFLVTVIYHDDAFTYIKSDAQEKPTLYELKDGKPSLVSFQFADGLYVVPKILGAGYLTVGKKRATFSRQTSPK